MPALLFLVAYCAACGPKATSSTAFPTSAQTRGVGTPSTPVPIGTATSTGLPTVGPAPRHFTEDFNSQPSHWVFVQADNGQTFPGPSVRDGFLVFDLAAANEWGYALYDAHSYTAVTVETQVQSRTAGDGAAGLVCDYDENKGWYEFNIFANQTYQLLFGQWLSKGVVRYTPLYQGESQAIRNDVNQLALECQGNLLAPSINGESLRKLPEQRFGLKAGRIGLSASSFTDAPFTIAFDWVKVAEP
jgi:hypothetical protein